MEDPPFENTNREDVWVDEISDNTARVSVPLYGKFWWNNMKHALNLGI